MKPEIKENDIVIRRAANGWIVHKSSAYEPGYFITLVYEDDGTPSGNNEAFIRMLRENFSEVIQSKKQGGISLEVKEHGYAYSDDGGNTPERIDEQISWLESIAKPDKK